MTLLALMIPCALADPAPLRQAGSETGVVVEAGARALGAAWWARPDLGFGIDWRLPAAAVSGAVGTRRRVELGPGPWAFDGFLAGGLVIPLVDLGLGLRATPAMALTREGTHTDWGLGLALPLELGVLPERRLRAPLLVETSFGVDLGAVEIGLRGGTGPVWYLPGLRAFALEGGIWLRSG